MNPNNPFYQYPMAQPYQQNFNQTQQNFLPKQTVIQVDGKASVDALRMAPDSSVLLMDRTAPIVWLCTSDGLGNVNSVAYDISVHKDAPSVDTNSFELRIASLEKSMAEIREGMNAKSNVKPNRSK